MKFLLLLASLAGVCCASTGPAADLATAIREAGLDPDACYRVRELNFSKEDVRLYLTEGHLIFAKPVGGRRLGAVFAANVEGGDAELLLMPPARSERASLATFTGSPNLTEHFRLAAMVFTDATAAELLQELEDRGAKKSLEAGLLMASDWEPLIRNLNASFVVRLVRDLLSPPGNLGFFYAALGGNKLGNFDVLYDPRGREQIAVGQLSTRQSRIYFDTWASFPARSFRNGTRTWQRSEFDIADFVIDVTVHPDLRVSATTKLKLTPVRSERVFAFDISKRVRVTSASIDGEPAEVFQRESLRAGLIRGGDNDLFLLVAPNALESGRSYEVEFRHEGDLVRPEGSGVYFVEARSNWYPHRNLQFARYDLTFRYPKELALVSTGEIVEERDEEEFRVTRRRIESPIRMAGFNLGDYEKAEVARGSQRVEIYANRKLERALQPRVRDVVVLPPVPQFPRQQRRPMGPDVFSLPMQAPPPSPTARLRTLAEEVSAAFEFMTERFGPPPLPVLTVSPIPGTFGQGFPGLVYLSTLSYLEPRDRPGVRDTEQQTFFSEMLHAHETAHQWWGNIVTSPGYQDDWLMESLANYSAMLFLEKRKSSRLLESTLASYRDHLLAKRPDGETIESTGPLSWGLRLQSSQAPSAWRTITYEKGSWVIHMLRRRLGDEQFFKLLGEMTRRYRFQPLTTEEFRQTAAEFVRKGSPDASLENFFDHWVYGTGIPELKLQYSLKGKAPNLRLVGTLTQTGVPEDFTIEVPIELLVAKQKRTVWLKTSSEPVPFNIALRQAPARVTLDPENSVLAVRK